MPAIIDTHTHMPVTRDALIDQLQRKAYYGVGAVMSLGQDTGDVAFQVREETIPNAARLRTAGRGITTPEPGRTEAPYWITTEAEARKAVQELAARKVDFVKIWVDDRDGKFKKLTPALYGAVIDEAHKNKLRVTAHIFTLEDAKGLLRAGIDAFAHGVRDKDIDDEFVAHVQAAPERRPRAEPSRSRSRDGSQLAERIGSRRRVEETAGRGHRSARRSADVRHPGAQSGQAQCGRSADRPRNGRQRRLGAITSRWRTWCRRA